MVHDPQMEAVYAFNQLLMDQMFEYDSNAIIGCNLYTIPIVVHVIHLGESVGSGTNISDAQIQSAIEDLNDRFRNEHELSTDICIEFCLAVRDPEGNSTNGIVRVNGYDVCLNGACYQNIGITDANDEVIKGLSRWPNTDYYNIWIVSEINGNDAGAGVQGYATFPGTDATKDGVVVLYNAFGTTGNLKSYTDLNTVLVHETGHFFNLYHTFEGDDLGTSCPTNTDCSFDGDHVCDTPPHIRSNSDCDENGSNSCDSNSPNEKFVHNYMDYSDQDCKFMFTGDQRTLMRCALLTTRAGLTYSLGCHPACNTVEASYTGGSYILELGTNVTYTNTSTNGETYVWRLDAQVIATTTNLNYTFNQGGIFQLCLDATGEHCTNRFCTEIVVVPICMPPQNECEKVTNGNFEQIYSFSFSNPTNFNVVCGWDKTQSSPFYCAQPENNCVGLYFVNIPGLVLDYEKITSELPLDLEIEKECELSFDYYVATSELESIIIALTEDNSSGPLPMDATIIAQIDYPTYDPTQVGNNKCYPEEAQFQHYYDESFAYSGDGNLYLNVTGTMDGSHPSFSLLYIDNLSISCCLPDCIPEPDFTSSIDSCDVTFYGVNTGDAGLYIWDFGDGSSANGAEVSHTYLWPGIYDVCLLIECEEFGAQIICKEIEIPTYCDSCTQLPPVISRECDEEDSTYVAQFDFLIPSGYAPCGSGLFVTSEEVQIAVNSFSLDSFNLTSSIVTASLHLIPPYGFDFEVDSAFLYITFCDTSGHMICYTVAVIGATCDFCEEIGEPVIAECNEELSTQSLFVYEGTFVFDVGVSALFIEAIAPSVGFEILSSSHISATEWSFDFSITTTDLDFSNISALFVFRRISNGNYLCFTIPFAIDTTCPTIPVECKSNWQKTILCGISA